LRRVVGEEAFLRDKRGDGADVDDRAAAGPADVRDRVLGHQRRAHDVDGRNPLPVLDARLDPLEDEGGGVVDEDVQRAQLGHDLLDRPLDARAVAAVCASWSRIATAAPASTKTSAMPRPIPCAPPVTIAVFPASRSISGTLLQHRPDATEVAREQVRLADPEVQPPEGVSPRKAQL